MFSQYDSRQTPTEFEASFRFDLCCHTIQFLLKACQKDKLDGKSHRKSYRVIATLIYTDIYIYKNPCTASDPCPLLKSVSSNSCPI